MMTLQQARQHSPHDVQQYETTWNTCKADMCILEHNVSSDACGSYILVLYLAYVLLLGCEKLLVAREQDSRLLLLRACPHAQAVAPVMPSIYM